jgi:hypothetical protein
VPAQATGFADLYDGLAVGVYSALRTYEHNKFLSLEDHLARTERSMALLGWQYELDRTQLCRALHEICTDYPAPDSRVRFDVLTEPAFGTNSRVLIALMPLIPIPDHFYDEGVAVGFAPDLWRENPLAKTADFVQKRRAYAAGTQDCFDYLHGNGAIDFTALAHQAAERELDIRLGRLCRQPCEHFRRAVEAVIHEVVETGEVVDVAP